MVDFKNKIEWIKVDELKPTPNNPNFVPSQIMTSLVNHIKKEGFYGSIIINDENEVVDGWHRTMALKSLGVKEIPCIREKNWNKDQSRIQTVRFNRERGVLTPIELSTILKDTNLPIDILAKQTDIPTSDLPELLNFKYDPNLDILSTNSKEMIWSDVEKWVNKLANIIKSKKILFDKIYTVSRGGLIPARLLADKLGIDSIIVDQMPPDNSLFVDDIYDSGKTYNKYGKNVALYCVLYLRINQKCPDNVIYAEITSDDKYINFVWEKTESKKLTN